MKDRLMRMKEISRRSKNGDVFGISNGNDDECDNDGNNDNTNDKVMVMIMMITLTTVIIGRCQH